MNTNVTREQADSYFIDARDEEGHRRGWARIFVQSGLRAKARQDDSDTWWVCVAVISDWGNFGHLWSHCGAPPERFLARLERGYAMGKFLGEKLMEYDGEETLRNVKRWLIERRREHDLDKEQAREAWNEVCLTDDIIEGDINGLVRVVHELAIPARAQHDDPWELAAKRINPQAEDFWRWAWPPFVEALAKHAAERSASDVLASRLANLRMMAAERGVPQVDIQAINDAIDALKMLSTQNAAERSAA